MKRVLQPGEIVQMAVTGLYLIARRIEGRILISDAAIGMPDTEIKQSDIVTLKDSRSIEVKNAGTSPATVDLQNATVPIATSDGGAVMIAGGSIDSIRDSIQVTASATVENGTVTNLSPDTISQGADLTIAAGATVTAIAASPTDKKRVVILQNISDAETVLRVGGAPSANAGAVLAGSLAGIASLEIDTTGALKVFNASASPAKVSIMWSKR